MMLNALLYTVYQLVYPNRITVKKIVNKGVKVLLIIILTGCKLDIYRQQPF